MSEPALPLPVIFLSPSVGWSTCGVSDFPFSFTVVVVSDGFLSFSVWVTTISWPFSRVSPSGTVTDQVPSSFTLVCPIISSPLVTTISDPATPLPVIFLSPSVGWVTSGVFDSSWLYWAVTSNAPSIGVVSSLFHPVCL